MIWNRNQLGKVKWPRNCFSIPSMNRACFHFILQRILFACISNTNFLHLYLEQQMRHMMCYKSYCISLLDHVPLMFHLPAPLPLPDLKSRSLPPSNTKKRRQAAPMPIKEPTKHNHPSQNPGGGIHLGWSVLKALEFPRNHLTTTPHSKTHPDPPWKGILQGRVE